MHDIETKCKLKKEVHAESLLNFQNFYGPDLNTIGKGFAQAESATERLLLRHSNKITIFFDSCGQLM